MNNTTKASTLLVTFFKEKNFNQYKNAIRENISPTFKS